MNKTSLLLVATITSLLTTPLVAAEDFSQVSGIKDACVASSLLNANRIPNTVVVFHSLTEQGAGCLYRLNGEEYLYTVKGSAKVNPAQVAKVPLEKVAGDEVARISDGDRDLKNGCMVFATCAFSQYKHDSHILWAGLIAAQIININNYGSEESYRASVTGHAITAFETDKREIYIQENGDEPRKVDSMTELAQRGDLSWHDSAALVYCDHHIQAITAFKDQLAARAKQTGRLATSVPHGSTATALEIRRQNEVLRRLIKHVRTFCPEVGDELRASEVTSPREEPEQVMAHRRPFFPYHGPID